MKVINNLKNKLTYTKILNIVLVFVLIQPLFDIISNLSNYGYIKINLVTYIKPLFILVVQLLLFIKNGITNNVKYYLYYLLIFIYVILHSILLLNINVGYSVVIHEVRFIINIVYFIVLYLLLKQLYNKFENKDIFYNKLKKTLLSIIIIYVIFYLIALVSNTSWLTYEFSDKTKLGFRGWYYSGQIFGHLLCISLPVILHSFLNSKLKQYQKYLILLITTIPFLLIGTKVSYFIVPIVYIEYIILNVFYKLRDNKKFKIKIMDILFCTVVIATSLALYEVLPVHNNININNSVSNEISNMEKPESNVQKPTNSNSQKPESNVQKPESNIQKPTNNSEKPTDLKAYKYEYWIESSLNHLNKLYSEGKLHSSDNRNRQLHYMNYLYSMSSLEFKLLGIGYLNHPNYLSIERDIIMPFYSFGILGALIFLYVIYSLLFKVIYKLIKNISTIDFETLILISSFCMFICISYFAGATYIYTQFSLILSIIMILLNIKLDNYSGTNANSFLEKNLQRIYQKSKVTYYKEIKKDLKNNKKKFIITANPETITMAETDEEISKMLLDKNNSIVPDGIAIVKACKILNIKVTERIAGIDIAEYLLKECNLQKKSLYLFGAKPEVIEQMVLKINTAYPNIKLVGYSDGYVKDRDKIFKDIIKKEPDVCLVALGIPHQEKLIYKHLDKFNKGIFVGVGGSFDVLSGTKKRAPKIFIKLNLEWLYRIACEPKRLKRFWDNNIKFIFKIYKERNKN